MKIPIPFEDASGKQHFCLLSSGCLRVMNCLYWSGKEGAQCVFFLTTSHHLDKEVMKRGENHHQLP